MPSMNTRRIAQRNRVANKTVRRSAKINFLEIKTQLVSLRDIEREPQFLLSTSPRASVVEKRVKGLDLR